MYIYIFYMGETHPHLFVLSIVLANSNRGKLSHLSGSALGRHLVGSKSDHSQKPMVGLKGCGVPLENRLHWRYFGKKLKRHAQQYK
jgi:hypothetical protein